MASRMAGLADKTRALVAGVTAKAKDDEKEMKAAPPVDDGDGNDNEGPGDKDKEMKGKMPVDPEDKNDGGADDGTEDKNGDPKKKAVAGERARWAAVFRSEHAAGRTDAAVELLGETDLSADKVTAMLAKFPAAALANAFQERMDAAPNPSVQPNEGTAPLEETAKERMAKRHGVKLS